MRANGKLYFETISEETINELGEVEFGEESWSDPIPCFIQTNSDSRRGKYENGEFRMASFTVLLELDNLPFTAESRIRLDRQGESLGDYRVLSLESHNAVGRVKIVV